MKSIRNLKSKLLNSRLRGGIIVLGLLSLCILAVIAVMAFRVSPKITNFDECAAAGYPIQESYPPVCRTYDGKSFTQQLPIKESPSETLTPREFTILVSSGNAATTDVKNVVAKTQTEWQSLWDKTYAGVKPKPPLLPVDFAKDMVVGIFAGTKPNGGYYTKVSGVQESTSSIIVNIKEVEPGKNCIVTMAQTSPHYFVSIQRSDKPVEFKTTVETLDCDATKVQP